MTSGVPVPTAVPPQLTVYQARLAPAPPVAVRLMLPASSAQKLFLSTDADVGAVALAQTTIAFVSVNALLLIVEQEVELLEVANEILYVPGVDGAVTEKVSVCVPSLLLFDVLAH